MINGESRPLRPFEPGEIGPVLSAIARLRDGFESSSTGATAGLIAGSRSATASYDETGLRDLAARPAGALALVLPEAREQGMPDARCTRGLARNR